MDETRQEMHDYIFQHAKSREEFEFWRQVADYISNMYTGLAHQPSSLPETGKFSRGEAITPEDFDMLVVAVKELQEQGWYVG